MKSNAVYVTGIETFVQGYFKATEKSNNMRSKVHALLKVDQKTKTLSEKETFLFFVT